MNFRRTLLVSTAVSTILFLGYEQSAWAVSAIPAAYDWTGFYAGVGVGGVGGGDKGSQTWTQFEDEIDALLFGNLDPDPIQAGGTLTGFPGALTGAGVDLHAGYNAQVDNFLWGLEADLSFGSVKAESTYNASGDISGSTETVSYATSVSSSESVITDTSVTYETDLASSSTVYTDTSVSYDTSLFSSSTTYTDTSVTYDTSLFSSSTTYTDTSVSTSTTDLVLTSLFSSEVTQTSSVTTYVSEVTDSFSTFTTSTDDGTVTTIYPTSAIFTYTSGSDVTTVTSIITLSEDTFTYTSTVGTSTSIVTLSEDTFTYTTTLTTATNTITLSSDTFTYTTTVGTETNTVTVSTQTILSTLTTSSDVVTNTVVGAWTSTVTGRASIDWMTEIKGRVGMTVDRTLFYALAGIAVGQITQETTSTLTVTGDNPSVTTWHGKNTGVKVGYVIGAGIEQALDDHWRIGAEAEYFNLGTATYDVTSGTANTTAKATQVLDGGSFKVNLNYGF